MDIEGKTGFLHFSGPPSPPTPLPAAGRGEKTIKSFTPLLVSLSPCLPLRLSPKMDASLHTAGASLMAVVCDFLIVGGGVIGNSIAFHLAQRRAGRVLLLEKSFLGAGSSGKSGAIVRQHYSNRLTALMARQSLGCFQHFDNLVGGPPVFTATGMVIVVNEKDRAGLEANVAMQR